ncbi:MAG: hypothetical protein IIB00_08155, partial [candidate division Zixibacteria bacterium]|nr:hypothetical protein [candidate division Zixibacteria bacterium]
LESFKDLPKLTEIEELMRDYQEAATPLGTGAGMDDHDNEENSAEDVSDEIVSDEKVSSESVPDDTTEINGDDTEESKSDTAKSKEHAEEELVPTVEQD